MTHRYSDEEERPLSVLRDSLRDAEAAHGPSSAQKPLINQTSNRWIGDKPATETEEREFGFTDLDDDHSCPRYSTRDAVCSRRFRRIFLICVLLLGLGFWAWKWYLLPRWEMEEGFTTGGNGTFGIAKGGDFDGTWLQDLDPRLLPGGEADQEGRRRLIFVGDIHGCADELKQLLDKVSFNEKLDHLVAVGDVISKGPDHVGVLDELIRLGASSVRGNHEDRILAIAPSVLEAESTPSAEVTSDKAAKDAKLLRQLSKKHLKYLRDMPLMLRIPALPMAAKPTHHNKSPLAEEIIVAHAGLVPAVSLEKQDPYFVMNMRSIHTKSHLPLAEAKAKHGKSKPWYDIWSWYNDRLFRKKSVKDFMTWDDSATNPWADDPDDPTAGWDSWFGATGLMKKKKWPPPQVVVYGHHSKAGLQLDRWSKGLDTGCVKGQELTAMVLEATGKWSIISVGCKDYT